MEKEELVLNLLRQLLDNVEEMNRRIDKLEKEEVEHKRNVAAYLCEFRDELQNNNFV